MRKFFTLILAIALALPLLACPKDELHIVTTGDVHGSFFSKPYVGDGGPRPSLMSVKYYVDSLRNAVGRDNVLLLDCGDIIQGDNASYYFNYIATAKTHVYSRMAAYMGYDACTVGNHDIEAGHPVYDRLYGDLKDEGIPWLAGNAFKPDGSTYFPGYTIIHKGGRKILVLGFNNANIDNWLSEELWSGMHHASLVPLVQEKVNEMRARVKPDVLIVLIHSGTGEGDASNPESQGLDVFNTLEGADLLVCAHDHKPFSFAKEGCVLVNAGARAANVGHAVLKFRGRRIISRSAAVVRLDPGRFDVKMQEKFAPDWEEIRQFTVKPVGELAMSLDAREAYRGMNDYISLLHTVQLASSGADLSLAAPLSFSGYVKPGTLIYNDMFTIYPYENKLYVLKLTGAEIRHMMEYSYDLWICTPGPHVLNIKHGPDPRTGSERWSFVNRSYNFDSVGGLVYEVDVTRPAVSRIRIISLADGTPFDDVACYQVAMTSYRANGGGSLLTEGAGIPHSELPGRIVRKLPEVRDCIYSYIVSHGKVDHELVSDQSEIGAWKFVPEAVVAPLMDADMALMF